MSCFTYKLTNTTGNVCFPEVFGNSVCEPKFLGLNKYYKYDLDSCYRLVLSVYVPGTEPFALRSVSRPSLSWCCLNITWNAAWILAMFLNLRAFTGFKLLEQWKLEGA